MDFQEGYCDGLAGAGGQGRFWSDDEYDNGFILGSLDRHAMRRCKKRSLVILPSQMAIWDKATAL